MLLVAIQDESFESIRYNVFEKLKRSVNELLGDIKEKDASLLMKDRVRSLQGDATIPSRRTQVNSKVKSRGKQKMPWNKVYWLYLLFLKVGKKPYRS